MVEHSEAASRFDNLVVLDHGSKLERHVPVAKTLISTLGLNQFAEVILPMLSGD